MINVADARDLARRRLPRPIFDFLDGAAEDEVTARANIAAFKALTLDPRYLADIDSRDLSTTVLGDRIELPVLLAPVGLQGMLTREGELASARAAGRAGTIFAVSGAASRSLEEIAAVATGPVWGQVKLGDRAQVQSYCDRAARLGVRALTVVVDTPVLGNRERDRRNRATLRLGARVPEGWTTIPPSLDVSTWRLAIGHWDWFRDVMLAPAIELPEAPIDIEGARVIGPAPVDVGYTPAPPFPEGGWKRLEWLRGCWSGGLVIKGLTHPEDARQAAAVGVDGIVVSNHGGRQLDGAPATLDALVDIVEAVRSTPVEVYLDGGVRRGSDVVKALALGARACLIGRPYLYALGGAREAGVDRVLEIFRSEIDRVLALVGRSAVTEIDRSVLRDGATDRMEVDRVG